MELKCNSTYRSMFLLMVLIGSVWIKPLQAGQDSRVEPDGTIHVEAFDFPESSYLSEETRAALRLYREVFSKELLAVYSICPGLDGTDITKMPKVRECRAEAFYKTQWYKRFIDRYDVNIAPAVIDGVYVEEFTPADGALKYKDRVLINLHGGAFKYGARFAGRVESIPIASLGRYRVISIDYRQAPEHVFPAASQDVATVYRELLKQYKPENIGLYGGSAGSALTAQSIAWFLEKGLPLPGALGMSWLGAYVALDEKTLKWGDSGYISSALIGQNLKNRQYTYFSSVDYRSPLVSPGGDQTIMAQFPPTVLTAATRDAALSSVVSTHAQLTRLGVVTDLHIWEGLDHSFTDNPELPESREAFDVLVNFFDKQLGQ